MEYNLEELLNRGYEKINIKKSKNIFIPPQIKIQNKRTYITNINDICQCIKRDINDVIEFINDKLVISIICNEGLKINNIYNEQQIKEVLSKYIKNYVICKSCKSINTIINIKNKQKILKCNDCKCEYTCNSFDKC